MEFPNLRLVALLGAFFAAISAWELARGLWAMRWPTVRGHVVVARARRRRGRGGGYKPAVRYAYQVGAERLEGTRLGFGWEATHASKEGARKEVGALVPGAEVVVYYNPLWPRDAALRPGVTVFTPGLLVVGVILIVYGLRS